MDGAEDEENLFAAGNWKLHGGMCKQLNEVVYKFLSIFPILEAAKPASKSGIQALCSLHIALAKAKRLLQHCSECSKIYLAITGESVLLKFQKARSALLESLQHVDEKVPPSISCQLVEILSELEATEFALDQLEKQAGDELIQLLQKDGKLNATFSENAELEIFHQAASKLGIASSRAALTERRALKKVIEKACAEEDKKKESIVAYLLHLMRKYSKLFRSEAPDDTDSQGSSPCSPTLDSLENVNENGPAFVRQLSKLGSFNSKQNEALSGSFPIPPEELRCPISLQLMYDPVIISSGQTYERVCIEKWFNDGHRTCPKTQQELSHISLTPNYCLKSLITSWCEQNGVPIPDGPPASLDFNYWKLALTESEATDSRSMESNGSFRTTDLKAVPIDKVGDANLENGSFKECGVDGGESYVRLANVLSERGSLAEQRKAVEEIRARLKDDEAARICMGANGFAGKLVRFLETAICELDEKAQEVGAMALFNLAVNNNSNKERILRAEVIPLLEEMIAKPKTSEAATALYLNLSCLDEARPAIGSSRAVPFLIQFLQEESNSQSRTCRLDALYTLYNLSTVAANIPTLISFGIIKNLHSLLGAGYPLVDKSLAIFINIALKPIGRKEMIATLGLIGSVAEILDAGEPAEREQAAACLWVLCNQDEGCIHQVLQEGVIPALVSLAANGTQKGKERAQKLLSLFREQRQRELSPGRVQLHEFDKAEFELDEPPQRAEVAGRRGCLPEVKQLSKSRSRRLGRALTSIWKHRNFSRRHRD